MSNGVSALGLAVKSSNVVYRLPVLHTGRRPEVRGLFPGHGTSHPWGLLLKHPCFKGSWKQTPYSEPAPSKLRFKALKTCRKWRSTWLLLLKPLAFEVPNWHKPERVTVLLPGPYASGMTHPSLHGRTCGVSWKEYGRSQPAPRTERLCKPTVKISASDRNRVRSTYFHARDFVR